MGIANTAIPLVQLATDPLILNAYPVQMALFFPVIMCVLLASTLVKPATGLNITTANHVINLCNYPTMNVYVPWKINTLITQATVSIAQTYANLAWVPQISNVYLVRMATRFQIPNVKPVFRLALHVIAPPLMIV